MNNTNNALETLVQRDKQIKKTNDKLKASINELNAELETTTNALSNHASNTDIHTSKEELIQLIIDHLESLDLGITKEVVSVLPTENISDNTLYFVPNDKGSHNEYLYINDMWELVGSTETNFTDYYTKQETDTLLDGKANSVHTHVVSDITDFPTIPTKLSQLENDMGFGSGSGGVITSVSWTNITDKPNFATVATSGSYTDLSNTPTIPTKVSQLENDTGFINALADVVDTKSNQTIGGNKTFNNNVTVCGNVYDKNVQADLTQIPTSNIYTQYRFVDKNGKTMGYVQHVQRTNGINQLTFIVRDSNNVDHGFWITTDKELLPAGNNTYSLGSSGLKWANVYSTNNITNKVITYSVTNHDNTSSMTVSGGSSWDTGSTLFLYGNSHSNYPGAFNLTAKNTTNESKLIGFPNGTLTWGGKSLAIDENLVHRSGDEKINGTKMFSNTIYRYADLTTSGGEQVYRFDDTNANACGHIYNTVHWNDNAVFNRHGAYNAKSGKSMEIDIISNDSGVGMAYVAGTANKGNLETVTSETGHSAIATMGWVNNPDTSTNVVHRSGDETIAGNKTFSNRVSFPSGYFISTDTNDNSLRISRSGSGHGNNYKVIIQGDTGKIFAPNGFKGNLEGNADSATYATTQATSDNSTKIATTAWVRTYVNSVVGSNTVGSSVSAYWSNSSNVTATGQASAHSSSSTIYPACYSDYINKTPTVGTIYSGAQLYTEYGTSASATGTLQSQGQYVTRITTTQAQVTFRSPISATGKYLCTTANTVKFRAYTAQGSTSTVGASSIVDYTITKSIFIRVE